MDFVSAQSTEEALSLLERFGDAALPMAGGTDVMVQLARNERSPAVILHLERIADLKRIARDSGVITLGALVTQRHLARDMAADLPGLAGAAALCGGWQTQNLGTVAGNICNASPAADLVPPLMVNGAEVILQGRGGQRRMPLSEFILDRRRTARLPDELVLAITVEPPGPRQSDRFEKVGRRGAMEIAIASVAVRVRLGTDCRTIEDVRIAIGSVAKVPFRVTEAERTLIGQPLTDEVLRAACADLVAAARPITDTRASAEYRRAVLPRVFARVLDACVTAAAKGCAMP